MDSSAQTRRLGVARRSRSAPKVTLYSRQGHDLSRRFPTVAAAVAKLPAKVLTLDGELVQAGERGIDFYALTGRQTRNVTLMAFDILKLDGKDLRGLPLEERLAQLEMLLGLSKVPGVALVPSVRRMARR